MIHLQLLIQKQFYQLIREKKSLISIIFNPIIWCCVIFYFNKQGIIRKSLLSTVGDIHLLTPVDHCNGENCVTIGYSIIGDEDQQEKYTYIDEIMRTVSEDNNLVF